MPNSKQREVNVKHRKRKKKQKRQKKATLLYVESLKADYPRSWRKVWQDTKLTFPSPTEILPIRP